jgi:hypothetical protein
VPDEPNVSEVVYQLQINPKGWLPAWLVNMIFVDEPIATFDKIQALLNKSESSDSK